MKEPTAGEVLQLRDQLERDASALLCTALFAFSRLDTNLGLMVASILRTTEGPSQALKADAMNFHKRMEFVSKYVKAGSDVDSRARTALTSWLQDADEIRIQRNQLVHGRWGIDPYKRKALNIVGLPTSNAQRTIEYSVEELEYFVQRIIRLQAVLFEVRDKWHLP